VAWWSRSLRQPGTLVVCIREKQMTLAQSSKRPIEDKIEAFNVGNLFRVFDEKIRTPGDGRIIFQGLQDHTAESIKSLEGYRIAWIEEAQTLSQRSLPEAVHAPGPHYHAGSQLSIDPTDPRGGECGHRSGRGTA
jgi:phage terminase large subunit